MSSLSDSSDAELLASPGDGRDEFGVLYERHVDDVLRYFVRRTGCAQTAADLTAETFTAALASRRRFRDTGAPGRAWLFKIAQRQLSRFIRREVVSRKARRRLGIQPLVLGEDDLERVERMVDFEALSSDVRDALSALPPPQAEALLLRIGDGLSYREARSLAVWVALRVQRGCGSPAGCVCLLISGVL